MVRCCPKVVLLKQNFFIKSMSSNVCDVIQNIIQNVSEIYINSKIGNKTRTKNLSIYEQFFIINKEWTHIEFFLYRNTNR
jgi:hypothetical protein